MTIQQIEVNDEMIVLLLQRSIADVVRLSKKKVNKRINELKEHGYVLQQGTTRGKYCLIEKTLHIVKKGKRIDG